MVPVHNGNTGLAKDRETKLAYGAQVRYSHLLMLSFMRYAISFLVVCCLYLAASPVNAQPHQSSASASKPAVISESWFDIDHDGQKEKVEILLEKGERYDDREEWCGKGEKWEGDFTIQIKKGDALLSRQPLNRLMSPSEEDPEPLSFWTPVFSLVFKDYNGDGQIDFNLGQYGSCNGNYYRLFTVKPDGTVSLLPIKDAHGFFVSPPDRRNSTTLIRMEKGILIFTYYDNTRGKQIRAGYTWDGTQFVPVKKTAK